MVLGLIGGVNRMDLHAYRTFQGAHRISTLVHYTYLVMLMDGVYLNLCQVITNSYFIQKICFFLHLVCNHFVYL